MAIHFKAPPRIRVVQINCTINDIYWRSIGIWSFADAHFDPITAAPESFSLKSTHMLSLQLPLLACGLWVLGDIPTEDICCPHADRREKAARCDLPRSRRKVWNGDLPTTSTFHPKTDGTWPFNWNWATDRWGGRNWRLGWDFVFSSNFIFPQVKTWFQNRRAKWRRSNNISNPSNNIGVSHSSMMPSSTGALSESPSEDESADVPPLNLHINQHSNLYKYNNQFTTAASGSSGNKRGLKKGHGQQQIPNQRHATSEDEVGDGDDEGTDRPDTPIQVA